MYASLLTNATTDMNPDSDGDDDTPKTMGEALASPHAEEWKKAIMLELDEIKRYKIWKRVQLPRGKSVVGTKWIFKVKRGPGGIITKFRARLVVKGYSQRQGIDYKKLFAPVIRHTSLRTLLSFTAAEGWIIDQMDVHVAFFNGELDEDIYISNPEGTDFELLPGEALKLV